MYNDKITHTREGTGASLSSGEKLPSVRSNATELLSDDYERETNVVVRQGEESPPAGGISYRPHLDLVGVAVRRTSNPLCTSDRCGMSSGKLTGLPPLGACDNRQGRKAYTRVNCEAPITRARRSQRLTDCDISAARRINRRKVLWCLAAVANRCNKSIGYYRWQRRGFVVHSVTRLVGFLCKVGSVGTRRSDTGSKGTKCNQAGQYGGWKEIGSVHVNQYCIPGGRMQVAPAKAIAVGRWSSNRPKILVQEWR